jgi:hypothetical protein
VFRTLPIRLDTAADSDEAQEVMAAMDAGEVPNQFYDISRPTLTRRPATWIFFGM